MDEHFSGLKGKAVPLVTDWHAESETGVSAERSVSDWAPYLSPGVPQYQPGPHDYADKVFDTVSCVSFATALGSIAAQANYLLLSLTEAQRYALSSEGFIVNGKVSISPRWLAHVSGTTRDGNSFNAVLEAARTVGLVPAADWAFTKDLRSFEDWIKRPPNYSELARKAKVWLSVFDLKYDWLFWDGLNLRQTEKLDRVKAALPLCPVLVGRPWCKSCNPSQVKPGVPIQDCGLVTSGHATCVVRMQPDSDQEVRDTYPIYDRVFDDGYHLHHAFRAVLTVKSAPVAPPKPPCPSDTCKFGDKTWDVKQLQDALVYLGYLKAPSPAGSPYYGPLTRLAVGKFQAASGIYPTAPDSFGPLSLAAMRTVLAAE